MGKMKIGQLKAREVCEAIKNGLGVAHFCVKYDCTEQEFERRLKQLYSKNEKDRKKKRAALRANDERLAKRAVKARESTSKNDESDYSEDLSTTDEVAAEEAEEIITVETATLEQLKAMEAELSDKLMLMETEHKEKARSHRDCIGISRELKKELGDMKVQLHGIRKKYEEVTAQDNDLIARMNEISAEHYNKSAEIQRVRERIKELSKVVVFVYADGSITAENLDVVAGDTVVVFKASADTVGDTLYVDTVDYRHVATSIECASGVMSLDSLPVGDYESVSVHPLEGGVRSVAVS